MQGLGLKVPVLFEENVTLPVGVVVLDLVAVTVAVQTVELSTATVLGLQEILVAVLGVRASGVTDTSVLGNKTRPESVDVKPAESHPPICRVTENPSMDGMMPGVGRQVTRTWDRLRSVRMRLIETKLARRLLVDVR
jgi:hypothetical protein